MRVKPWITVLGMGCTWVMFPGVAYADNCGSFSDCYNTLRAALAAIAGISLFAVLLSFGLDLLPGVGTVKGLFEAVSGRDLITGEELSWWERALGIVPLGGALIGGGVAATRMVRRAENVTGDAGPVLQTGARFGQRMDIVTRWETYAPEAYAAIRQADDVAAISRHTGLSEAKVQRIKDHVFFAEHRLDDGLRQFDADPDIADAWGRLQRGEHLPEDLRLLEHEYFESRFERIFQTDYRTAHDAANRAGRTWSPPDS